MTFCSSKYVSLTPTRIEEQSLKKTP
jgi:hypothetical protein